MADEQGVNSTIAQSLICRPVALITSRGIWFGDDPLKFSLPLLLLQMCLVLAFAKVSQFLLRPLGQTTFISHIIGGIILGPSFLGRNESFREKVFPPDTLHILITMSLFSLALFLFLTGVKMDVSMVRKSGKKVLAVASFGIIVPYILISTFVVIFRSFIPDDYKSSPVLHILAPELSLTNFPVVASFLSELKMLNTNPGRISMASALIGDLLNLIINYSSSAIFTSIAGQLDQAVQAIQKFISCTLLGLVVLLILRPLSMWMVRSTPKGEPVKDEYIKMILISALVLSFCSEIVGQHAFFGPFVLGLAIPDGPPLGTALVKRLDCIVSEVLLPIYFGITGLRTELFSMKNASKVVFLEMLILVGLIGKFLGTVIPCLFCKVPMNDSLTTGLIMNVKGVVQIIAYNFWRDSKIVDEETFSILITSVIIVTAIISPILQITYRPSKRYVPYRRRTIQHSLPNTELRIVACVHDEEQVPTLIDILQASNPTKHSPIAVYLIHLNELVGRASPIFSALPRHTSDINPTPSDHIINAFRYYESKCHGNVVIQAYTSVSPYATMHDDICSMALEKRVSLIIVPFHKRMNIDGTMGSIHRGIQNVNCNILDEAPCSVGIIIDRGGRGLTNNRYQVASLFLGGCDDREALMYGARMVESPRVELTVVRFISLKKKGKTDNRESKCDDELIAEFRVKSVGNPRVGYREESVSDGEGTISVIQSMNNSFDLMMVGRRQPADSPLISGLGEWSECPELGYIGDILASTDFGGTVSILVVQQHSREGLDGAEFRGYYSKRSLRNSIQN